TRIGAGSTVARTARRSAGVIAWPGRRTLRAPGEAARRPAAATLCAGAPAELAAIERRGRRLLAHRHREVDPPAQLLSILAGEVEGAVVLEDQVAVGIAHEAVRERRLDLRRRRRECADPVRDVAVDVVGREREVLLG